MKASDISVVELTDAQREVYRKKSMKAREEYLRSAGTPGADILRTLVRALFGCHTGVTQAAPNGALGCLSTRTRSTVHTGRSWAQFQLGTIESPENRGKVPYRTPLRS